ncbi:hypothetical protein [[Kitasatospora] papulosa]|uniref:hypothetical protein n=1 Tax=[Kitasatospora] papulosa TaxID=1464011 RepID=UPI0036C3115B
MELHQGAEQQPACGSRADLEHAGDLGAVLAAGCGPLPVGWFTALRMAMSTVRSPASS